jgi:hypothetical protein
VLTAIAADLELIAICDHNSARNAAAVQQAARDIAGDLFGVIAGIEATSAEEAHIVGLFPNADSAMAASDELGAFLPPPVPGMTKYGRQLAFNAHGNILHEEQSMLSWASSLSLSEVALLIRRHHGLVVAAHVDRPSFSVVSQLGFLPEDVVFDAIEISAAGVRQGKQAAFSGQGIPMISSSDAHYLSNIGESRTLFSMEAPTFSELTLALAGAGERICSIA